MQLAHETRSVSVQMTPAVAMSCEQITSEWPLPEEAAPFTCRSRSALLEGRSNLENRLEQQETRQVDTPEVKAWCSPDTMVYVGRQHQCDEEHVQQQQEACFQKAHLRKSTLKMLCNVTTIKSLHPGVNIAVVCTTTERIQHEKPDFRQQPGLQHVNAAL